MDNGADSYRRFLAGDDSGAVDLIRDYKDGLILYLNRFTRDLNWAEDLMEDTFVKLLTRRPSFAEKSSFKTWLYAIARRVALDALRRRARHPAAPLEDCCDLSDQEDLERSYLKEEQKIQLHRAISRLAPEYQQVLHLLYFEGFTNTQTAAILHKTNRQVENLVYRAKASLRSALEKEGFVYERL